MVDIVTDVTTHSFSSSVSKILFVLIRKIFKHSLSNSKIVTLATLFAFRISWFDLLNHRFQFDWHIKLSIIFAITSFTFHCFFGLFKPTVDFLADFRDLVSRPWLFYFQFISFDQIWAQILCSVSKPTIKLIFTDRFFKFLFFLGFQPDHLQFSITIIILRIEIIQRLSTKRTRTFLIRCIIIILIIFNFFSNVRLLQLQISISHFIISVHFWIHFFLHPYLFGCFLTIHFGNSGWLQWRFLDLV